MWTAGQRLLLIVMFATPEIVELGTAACALAWACWVLIQPQVLTMDIYHAHVGLLPAWVWGGLLLLLSGAQVVGLGTGHRAFRRRLALLLFGTWMFLGVTRWLADSWAPATVLYAMQGAGSLWVYWRLGFLWREPDLEVSD